MEGGKRTVSGVFPLEEIFLPGHIRRITGQKQMGLCRSRWLFFERNYFGNELRANHGRLKKITSLSSFDICGKDAAAAAAASL